MLLSRFIKNINDQCLFQSTDNLLLAVSGGVDSVVLCELCHRADFRFHVAHANFQLRGEESETDESFVRDIARKYRVPIHVKKFDTAGYASLNKVSVQVAARELRYNWFNELLKEGYQYLLTAHHTDDNIETALMNFFRGTGISGLRGILPKKEKIIRPLLPFTKKELIDFAKENKLVWREDSSNASDKYSRNYFRNAVIPMINKLFPEVERNLSENIRRFSDIETLYSQAIEIHKRNLTEQKGNEIHIPILKLKKAQPLHTIVYEITRAYDFTPHQVNDIIHLMDAEQGKFVQSSTHRIFRNRNWLIVSPNESEQSNHIIIEEGEKGIQFSNGTVEFRITTTDNISFNNAPSTALLDLRQIKYPLILRKWKQGDYFYPLGMNKKKKVARFLIDQKLSPPDKEKVWILESDKRICWIVGLRIDERFKVSENTKKVGVFEVKGQKLKVKS